MNRRNKLVPFGLLLSIGLALGWPTVGAAASCTISPQNPTVNVGGSVSWSASYSGFWRTPSYAWQFPEGTPSSSTSRTQSVKYLKAGTYTTSLELTYRSLKATCSTKVTVGGGQDTTPPTVSISSSAPGPFTPPATVTLNATATDAGGVSKVEFYDGNTLKGTDTSSPYSYNWSIQATDAGIHTWTAKAYDNAGNVGTSGTLNLTVKVMMLVPELPSFCD